VSAWPDLVMMRCQLLNLKRLAEGARTNKKGIAKLQVEPDSAGLLTVEAPRATTGTQKLGAVSNGGGGK
jgi:hypothetical protein